MHLISITTRTNPSTLIERIINNYSNENININKEVVRNGELTTINFKVNDIHKDYVNCEFVNIFKHYTAIAIADYIVDTLELQLIEKLLFREYNYLKPLDRKLIIEKLNSSLENEYYDVNIEVPYKVNKKAKILYKLMDFISHNDSIDIEGFMTFRLKRYSKDLKEFLDKIIEEYMMEKQYKEFIKLLKYFVNIQEPKVDYLNILVDKNGKYHFYDENNQIIDDSYIEEIVDDLNDTELNSDDLLISSLITIAPKKIIIHYANNIKNQEILETIKNIFDKRVFICNSCRICNLNRYLKEE